MRTHLARIAITILLASCTNQAATTDFNSTDQATTTTMYEGEEIHYHAGFVVYENGQKRDFNTWEYMQISPCEEADHDHGPEEEQLQKAHLHDQVGDVVHVHRKNAVWRDLFINLGLEIPSQVTALVNGIELNNPLDYPIYPYQSMIFFFGEDSISPEEYAAEYVTKDRIIYAESLTESCGT